MNLSLEIKISKTAYKAGERIVVSFLLANQSDKNIFIVKNRGFLRAIKNPELEISDLSQEQYTLKFFQAELPPTEDFDFYGYVFPEQAEVKKGELHKGSFDIQLPIKQTILDEKLQPKEITIEMPKSFKVQMVIGYGLNKFKFDHKSYDPHLDFLKWQKIVESNELNLNIK